VAERQWLWEATCAAKDSKQAKQPEKQALDKAQAHMNEIVQQRTINAQQGEVLLEEQRFEEVSDTVFSEFVWHLSSDSKADVSCYCRRQLCCNSRWMPRRRAPTAPVCCSGSDMR
jgi:hypothetical protein